ncbi:hypothetical protein [Kitasatospora cheerisanensis]|uniref:Lipoprotein n=1 Tax=Kitasatospora cheerisanensis KCTC 2395 TaxID=1348663 RepID=A0A066ZA08_9ACTN|nr:hypothetical protein [Kitasatospora cheerisanensis]KDN87131.1 hypothetical protein KCH_12160 [Kitasatospora cheerisanensis KCTC 2395]
MRPLRLAAAAVACLSAVAVLTACDPEGADGGSAAKTSAAPPAASGAPSSGGGASAPAPAPSATGGGGKGSAVPAAAWIAPQQVPLNAALHWTAPASSAKSLGAKGRFLIEQLCHGTRSADWTDTVPGVDTASLGGADGDWKADQSIVSFGDASKSSAAAQSAFGLLGAVKDEVRACAATASGAKAEITGDDSEFLVATVTLPQPDGGTVQVHEYLTTSGGALVELTLHARLAKGGHPKTAWSAPADGAVLSALAKPVCTAYKDC